MCWKFEAAGDKNLVLRALRNACPARPGAYDEETAEAARRLIIRQVESLPADRVSVLAVATGMSMQVSVGMMSEDEDCLPTEPPDAAVSTLPPKGGLEELASLQG